MTDNGFAGLPPRPDPETGQPFPPHGRGWHGMDSAPEDDSDRETRLSHKPEPPPGNGPVLAWHKESKHGKLGSFLIGVLIIVVGVTIVSAIEGDPPFNWMQYWQLWPVVVVGGVLFARPFTFMTLSAGADWCQLQLVSFGVKRDQKVVNLYDLHSIKAPTGTAKMYLELADNSDSIKLNIFDWQSDRRIWDLVYNGILHSVEGGARISHTARKLLKLEGKSDSSHPQGPRIIDVTRLSDAHVWELMEDPSVRHLCETIPFHGSAADFRELIPQIGEEMLTNPANPDWFINEDNTTTSTSDSEAES